MDYLLWLSSIVMATFMWPQQYTEFKQVEYDLSKTYEWVYKECDIPLSAVAYAFAVKESWNWAGHKQANKNNLFWLRKGTSKTTARPIFASYPYKSYTPNGYNVYNKRYDSIYDFMNQFYTRWCNLTKWYVKGHLNGWNGWWNGVDSYYATIIAQSNKFTRADIDVRVLLKPSSLIEFNSIIRWLEWNGFKGNNLIQYSYWASIVADSRNNTYKIRSGVL